MKCLASTTANGLALGLLLLAELVPGALAVPKTPWARERAGGRGRKIYNRDLIRRAANSTGECDIVGAKDVNAPKDNIWGGLTTEEAVSVTAWLFSQPDLNLTASENATSWDNTLQLVELNHPNKTDALAYIDGSAAPPARYAHAIISHGSSDEAYFQDILVGPLPVVNGTTKWEPLEYPYTRKTEGKVRNLGADDDFLYDEWHAWVGSLVADITLDLWNGTALGLANDTLTIWGIDPLYQDGDGRIKRWDTFFSIADSIFDTGSITPMGLFFMSDVTGRNVSDWTLDGWYYNGVFYESTDDFRSAFWGGEVEKLGGNFDGPWAWTDQRGPVPRFDERAPPVEVTPQGARYAVDQERKYVEWMGWSFYIGFTRDTGMALYDIRLKGQRILYELGLQEALAHYAGSDPTQSHTAYLDTFYGFGPYAFELVKGYDCPAYATYLNTSFYVAETTHTHLNSICVFESLADYPMMRHSAADYVAVSKNVLLTVRSVSTVGNYDYMFSYTFHMDGTLGVEVRASGYIQAAFYAKNEDYGFHIHDFLSGSMHDHVLNFKADFDILGTNNTVQTMDVVPVTTAYPWSNGKVFNTMQVQRKFLENENHGRFNWGYNGQQQVLVVNQEERNRYGELRGYRVLPGNGGTAHLTVLDSTVIKNSARWAEFDVSVSKRKDTEPRSAHPYNNQDTPNPPINFAEFFDGESLNQTDLVLWLNLGMHHVPNTADLPNTVFTTAHSGLYFTPVNYFNQGINIETVNMVRIDYTAIAATEVLLFGSDNQTCALDYEPHSPDLWEYHGDVIVRKLPYEPDDAYRGTIVVG
ncbi:copper amine oxidase [Stachybotrys elegans]|uniref:Amine oxidase n=1 Tax=Stachybotrys elegans TaxID=80388 RepID=A0A8K0WKF6_9HYPO|nr:copper amine oxidase [Stachybotrys elegans]